MTSGKDTSESRHPPADLPVEPAVFWHGQPIPERPPAAESESSLKRLGAFPVPRGAFPLMGFFATVYEHVSTLAREQLNKSK